MPISPDLSPFSSVVLTLSQHLREVVPSFFIESLIWIFSEIIPPFLLYLIFCFLCVSQRLHYGYFGTQILPPS